MCSSAPFFFFFLIITFSLTCVLNEVYNLVLGRGPRDGPMNLSSVLSLIKVHSYNIGQFLSHPKFLLNYRAHLHVIGDSKWETNCKK